MKRLKHYDKGPGIIMSVFGSSENSAMELYLQLFEEIKQELADITEIKIAVSSRTVLKKLEKQGNYYYTLPEQLAYFDRKGYKKVIVSSVNLFPTEEHEYVLQITDAFRKIISCAEYEVTSPLFTTAEVTNNYLNSLNNKLRLEYNIPNILYVAHGAKNLNSSGSQTYTYVRDYLNLLNPRNFFRTLEGAFAYNKELVSEEIKRENNHSGHNGDVLIVPLLLGTGNHSKNDIQEIKNELKEYYNTVIIPENFYSQGDFCLLKLEETRSYFKKEIKNALERILW